MGHEREPTWSGGRPDTGLDHLKLFDKGHIEPQVQGLAQRLVAAQGCMGIALLVGCWVGSENWPNLGARLGESHWTFVRSAEHSVMSRSRESATARDRRSGMSGCR